MPDDALLTDPPAATDWSPAVDDDLTAAPAAPEDLDSHLAELLRQAEVERVPELLNDVGAIESMRGNHAVAEIHLHSAHLLAPHRWDIERNLLEVRAHAAPLPAPPVERVPAPVDPFAGHYFEWRRKRIAAIVDRYGAGWFRGARVLELGCGHGDIGATLTMLGADVTFAEGRQEHLETIADRYPGIPRARLVRYDAEDPWPFDERVDLVIDMGLVYHVDNWQRSILGSVRAADRVVLETEVCDSDDPNLVLKNPEAGDDQAISGTGSRPSAAAVEALLRTEGCRFERVADNRCNAGFHRYDWPVTGSGGWEHGLRRFWFVWRPGAAAPV